MNRVGKEAFEEHMRRLGRLSRPNLLPLLAYYYRKDEKLLVADYVPKRSLAMVKSALSLLLTSLFFTNFLNCIQILDPQKRQNSIGRVALESFEE